MQTDTMTMYALYVSAPAHELSEKRKTAFVCLEQKDDKQRALYYKTRAAILQDRVMRGDLRGIQQ